MSALVRFANWGHRQPSTLVRRSTIILAVAGMAVRDLVWWTLIVPLLILLIPFGSALTALVKAVAEIPQMTIGEARELVYRWSLNWAGAKRIWAHQKRIEP